jgi:hypothetical protein
MCSRTDAVCIGGWQFIGGVLMIGTLIGTMASALFWLAVSGGDDDGEEER